MPVVIVVGVGPSMNIDRRRLNALFSVKCEKPTPVGVDGKRNGENTYTLVKTHTDYT